MLCAATIARADSIAEWNVTAGAIVVDARLGTPPANRVMAIFHTAVFEADTAITQRYPPGRVKLDAAPAASVDAAVAEANRATLAQMVPSQQARIERAYRAARWAGRFELSLPGVIG